MSARFASCPETDMCLPEAYFLAAAILASSRAKDNTEHRSLMVRSAHLRASRTMRPRCIFILRDAAKRPLLRMRAARDGHSSPRSPVLFVLRLDRIAGAGPVGVGPVAQLVEVSPRRQPLAAVHRDGLAVDPVAAAGNQEHREVLQLLHF